MQHVKKLAHMAMITTAIVGIELSAAHAGNAGDAALFAAYDQVNSIDIAMAELGVIKGSTEEVRAVAAMVLRDHSAVRQMARDIAEDAGIEYSVPTDNDTAKTHDAAFARLSKLKGAAFDRAYLTHEAPFHKAAADAVRTVLIPSAKTEEFRTHLETVLPHFEHHLSVTLETAKALGYETN